MGALRVGGGSREGFLKKYDVLGKIMTVMGVKEAKTRCLLEGRGGKKRTWS